MIAANRDVLYIGPPGPVVTLNSARSRNSLVDALPGGGCRERLFPTRAGNPAPIPRTLRLLARSSSATQQADSARRIHALVALRVLEALRDQDLPREFLEDEDPSRTMPRRFGLSDVVGRQIRTYQADARRGVRLPDGEVRDLFRFVIRRPDGVEVFHSVGRLLASEGGRSRVLRVMPRALRYRTARRRVRRRLRKLFGRTVGGFARGPFTLEGRSLFFVESDPDGQACHLVAGLCEAVLEQVSAGPGKVVHVQCQARGDALCRWEVERERPDEGPSARNPDTEAV